MSLRYCGNLTSAFDSPKNNDLSRSIKLVVTSLDTFFSRTTWNVPIYFVRNCLLLFSLYDELKKEQVGFDCGKRLFMKEPDRILNAYLMLLFSKTFEYTDIEFEHFIDNLPTTRVKIQEYAKLVAVFEAKELKTVSCLSLHMPCIIRNLVKRVKQLLLSEMATVPNGIILTRLRSCVNEPEFCANKEVLDLIYGLIIAKGHQLTDEWDDILSIINLRLSFLIPIEIDTIEDILTSIYHLLVNDSYNYSQEMYYTLIESVNLRSIFLRKIRVMSMLSNETKVKENLQKLIISEIVK